MVAGLKELELGMEKSLKLPLSEGAKQNLVAFKELCLKKGEEYESKEGGWGESPRGKRPNVKTYSFAQLDLPC